MSIEKFRFKHTTLYLYIPLFLDHTDHRRGVSRLDKVSARRLRSALWANGTAEYEVCGAVLDGKEVRGGGG